MTTTDVDTCNQDKCDQPSAYRFTWPRQDEAGICEVHVAKLRRVATACGVYCQIIPFEITSDGARA